MRAVASGGMTGGGNRLHTAKAAALVVGFGIANCRMDCKVAANSSGLEHTAPTDFPHACGLACR